MNGALHRAAVPPIVLTIWARAVPWLFEDAFLSFADPDACWEAITRLPLGEDVRITRPVWVEPGKAKCMVLSEASMVCWQPGALAPVGTIYLRQRVSREERRPRPRRPLLAYGFDELWR